MSKTPEYDAAVKAFSGPSRYTVTVTVPPRTEGGEHYTGRVGVTDDKSKIAGMIADDIVAMRDTFGGLIEPTSTSGRVYRVFEAKWTELDTMQILKDSDYGCAPAKVRRARRG